MNENLFVLFVTMALINNFILVRFLGLCPFFGISKNIGNAISMGIAVTFVMVIASAITWLINTLVLIPHNIGYMNIVMYILVIAVMVQIVEMLIKRTNLTLYNALGIYLPLLTVNCAILGASLFMVQRDLGFMESVAYGLGAGVGWALAIVMLAGLREKMKYSDIPEGLQGLGIAFITTGLISLAFMGIAGLSF